MRPDGRRPSHRQVRDKACYWVPGVDDALLLASYFDGHLAMTPLGATWKPSASSVPFRTTSASSANVSGTMPV